MEKEKTTTEIIQEFRKEANSVITEVFKTLREDTEKIYRDGKK